MKIIKLIVLSFCIINLNLNGQNTIIVDKDGNGEALKIQEGINMANTNDIVLVNPGVYKESVTINKDNIIVMGSGPAATAIYSTNGDAVTFDTYSDGSSIIGFSITSVGSNGIFFDHSYSDQNTGISNCIITGGQNGVHGNNSAGIANCIFINCGKNGFYTNANYNISITNSIFFNNSGTAIVNEVGASITSSYNIFWNNSGGKYGGNSEITIGDGNLSQDPLFIDVNSNYHLSENSPCINAGKPGLPFLDPDGTRNDMGAYGGPYANMSGFIGPVINNLEIYPKVVEQGDTITIKAKGIIR